MNVKPNTLFTGDNLYILAGMDSDSIDLIYLDPPFNSKRLYEAPVGSKAAGAAFKDMWTWGDVDQTRLESLLERYPAFFNLVNHIGQTHSKGMSAYVAYIAQRLAEMQRILKPTGSIYLHCDPTASHYLKLVMDIVFGEAQFLNEIVWHYEGPQSPSVKKFATKHDIILRYGKSAKVLAQPEKMYLLHTVPEHELRAKYKQDDSGKWFYDLPRGDYTDESIKNMDAEGRVRRTKSGKVRIKYYLTEKGGAYYRRKKISSVWNDIPSLGHAGGKEKVGYPTQKPLALMDRIIEASNTDGDLVLDPFCGCATTCVSAQNLHRKWIGIDISEVAATLVAQRMADVHGKIFTDFVHRRDVPIRTDIKLIDLGVPKTKAAIKARLYKERNGKCNGCQAAFEARNLDIDHITPESKGGPSHYDNYQLLCGNCNRIKGNRPMEYLLEKINARNAILNMRVTFD